MAKLRTPEVEKLLKDFPLYSQEEKEAEALVVCKFFFGSLTWYITEGNEEGEDFTLFGLTCNGQEAEFGYVSLNELESIEAKAAVTDTAGKVLNYVPLHVERDLNFKPITLKELAEKDDVVKQHLLRMEYI